MRIEPEEDARKILFSNEYDPMFEATSNAGICMGINKRENTQVIFFNPDLFLMPKGVFMGIAAHELAHLFLKHWKDHDGDRKEEEADEQAAKWGFERQLTIAGIVLRKLNNELISRFAAHR